MSTRISRTRTARIKPDGFDRDIYIDFVRPRTPEALAAKDAIDRHHSVRAVKDAGASTAEEVARVIAAAGPEGAEQTEDAIGDLASICAAHIRAVYVVHEDGTREDVAWEDYDDKAWGDLAPDERVGVAYDNSDVCVWSIAFELTRGAYPTRLGELSAPRRTDTPRT